MVLKSIGQTLLQMGAITENQLQECQAESQQKGKSVEICLLEKKYITPEQCAQAYATYSGIPYVEKITEQMADLTILGRVPIKFLRDNTVMPVVIDGNLVIVTANPLNFQPLDELNLLLGGQRHYAVATPKIIVDAINRYYPLEGTKQMIAQLEESAQEELEETVDFGDIEEKDIVAMAAEAPIIKLVNHIFYQAVKRGASDIHIEPYEKELVVRYRIDGVLYPVMNPPKRIQGALVSRIKIMANLNIAEKRVPQDGRIDIRVAGKPIDIRVSILPVAFGERIVMRLLDKSRTFGKLKDLGFSDRDLQVIMNSITKPNGIIYITGPTGSGKTSTLYVILGELNQPDVNIITVEDPVEYQMPGIGQVHVKEKIGLDFASALRSILRQDPDIIMIGETRDQETAQIAIQAALTGHLVLSTLHTNSAPATITRLLDMGIEPFLIASSIILSMAQRLVRKLCSTCKVSYKPDQDLLKSVGLTERDAQTITFYKPVGCEECNQTGYKGRIAIFELMLTTSAISNLIMQRADTAQIRRQAIADGMTTLLDDGIRKIKQGLTTIDEVLAVATLEQEVVE
ncbi:MAG: type II secretion system ATPase GspE [Candidatus Dependentiae bacterium]